MFGLAPNIKVALHMGSFDDWTGAPFLLESTRQWPDDWMLVVHHRFGATRAIECLFAQHGNPERIRFSAQPFHSHREMLPVIQSADLGVALYKATYAHQFVGKNIVNVGLSSGKISSSTSGRLDQD